MSQFQPHDIDKRSVHGQAETNVLKANEMLTNIQALLQHSLDTATLFTDNSQRDRVAQLRSGHAELLKLEQEVLAYKDATQQEVIEGYNPKGVEATKFDQLLNKATKEKLKQKRFDVERCEGMQQFDRDTGGVGQRAGGADDEDDEDFVMEEEGSALVNTKCPLTMKDVMELDEPVEDARGYVYEKAAIVDMLNKQRDKTARCPVAGTNHNVSIEELKPSRRVVRERRRQVFMGANMPGTQAGAGRADQAVDVDDL